jgi:uncharacterized protein (TIGR00369 family)
VGLQLLASAAGRATVILPVSEDLMSESAGVDGGAISALVEAAGAAATSPTPTGETVELFISFVRSPPPHPLTAEARVVRTERDLRLCEVDVRDWNGDLVARGSVTRRS